MRVFSQFIRKRLAYGIVMKSIKNKLYDFLVTSRPLVRDRYQNYVCSNKEYHKNHRFRSWVYLYHLLKFDKAQKKLSKFSLVPSNVSNSQSRSSAVTPSPRKSDCKSLPVNQRLRLPYLDGSESFAFKREEPIFFAKRLMPFDIISFDIFDTLILRTFSNPTDLFMVVGNKLNLTNFKKIRIDAEKEARSISLALTGSSEITLEDIYKQIQYRTGLNIKQGVEAELSTEADFCFPNQYFVDVLKILKEFNKTIIFTSDMYLSKAQITKLLYSCGIVDYDNLYISCEYGCSKRSGNLFKQLKFDYPNKSIVHIGDNPISDYSSAKELGINTFFYKNCHEIGNPFRADGMSDLIGSFYSGIVNTHLHNGINVFNPYYEYGFIYGGLYILGFCNWIHKKSKLENIDKILFLSRDGDIYKKVYNILFNDSPNEYVLWSRIANTKYTMEHNKDDFLTRMVTHKALSPIPSTFKDILVSIQLDFLLPLLEKTSKLKGSSLLTQENKILFEKFLSNHWDSIVENMQTDCETARLYLSSIIGASKKIAVIDVGWLGSGPLGIKYLVEEKWKMNCNVKCLLAASHFYIPESNINEIMNEDIETYIFSRMYNRNLYDTHKKSNKGTNNIFFEFFSQSCSPSFNGFSNGSFLFDMPEINNYEITRDIHSGILDFCKIYRSFANKSPYLFNISGYDAYMPFRFAIRDIRLVKSLFEHCSFSRNVGVNLSGQKQETVSDILNPLKI